MENEKKRKQMAFDIHPEMHQQIKILAARRNISISSWMSRAAKERIQKEMVYDIDREVYLQE